MPQVPSNKLRPAEASIAWKDDPPQPDKYDEMLNITSLGHTHEDGTLHLSEIEIEAQRGMAPSECSISRRNTKSLWWVPGEIHYNQ